MGYITSKWTSGLDHLAEQETTIKSTTNADIQAFAKMILENKNQIKVMMRPEVEKAE